MALLKVARFPVPVTIRIPGELHDRLQRLAAAEDRSVSWIVRRCIELALEHKLIGRS